MFVYCPKCGYIFKQKREKMCPVCEGELQQVPDKYLSPSKQLFQSQKAREEFIDEIVKTNSQYSAELAQQRDSILEQKDEKHRQEVEQKVQDYKETKPMCKCPVCGSTNLSAISNLGKVVKISLIGVWGAGDLGKKRYCNSCGHKF